MKGWSPQKPTKLDRNDTTTLTRHPYILCHFAVTQVCFVFVSCVQRMVVEGSGVGIGRCVVVLFDVHGD